MSRLKQAIGCVMILSLILSLIFFFSGTGAAADKSKWPQKMNVVGGPMGGAGFTSMSAWSPQMNTLLGTNIAAEATGGITINTQMVNNNQAHFGVSTTTEALEGWEGSAKWTKGNKLRNYRAMAILDPFATQFFSLKSSNITNIRQINGKSVNLSRAGSSTDYWGRKLFEVFYIKPSKILNLNPSDAGNLLGDRLLDVATVQGGLPHPAIAEASVNNELTVFGVSPKDFETLSAKYPSLYQVNAPGGVYKGQKDPFVTFGSYTLLIAHKDIPDDLVFELVQATFKNREQLAAAYKAYMLLKPEDVKYSPIPLHRGAYQYYQKAGVTVPKAAMPLE